MTDLDDWIDAVRLNIGDDDGTLFTDDQITTFLTRAQNEPLLAASYAATALAGRYATRVSKSVGSRSISNSDLFKHYTALAAALKDQHANYKASANSRLTGSFHSNPEREQIFTVGMWDQDPTLEGGRE